MESCKGLHVCSAAASFHTGIHRDNCLVFSREEEEEEEGKRAGLRREELESISHSIERGLLLWF